MKLFAMIPPTMNIPSDIESRYLNVHVTWCQKWQNQYTRYPQCIILSVLRKTVNPNVVENCLFKYVKYNKIIIKNIYLVNTKKVIRRVTIISKGIVHCNIIHHYTWHIGLICHFKIIEKTNIVDTEDWIHLICTKIIVLLSKLNWNIW